MARPVEYAMVFPSDRVRRVASVLRYVAVLNFVCMFLLLVFAGTRATETPHDDATYPLEMRGHARYVPRWMGLWVEIGFWSNFGLFGLGVGVPLLLGACFPPAPRPP